MRITDEPHTLLHYQCSPYHTNSALYPFIAQLAGAVGFKADDLVRETPWQVGLISRHSRAAPSGHSTAFCCAVVDPVWRQISEANPNPARQRRRTFTALLNHFENLARQKPILLLFEDGQWADSTSLEFVDLVVGRVRQLPVLPFSPGDRISNHLGLVYPTSAL